MLDFSVFALEFVTLSGLEGISINKICEEFEKKDPYHDFNGIKVDQNLKNYIFKIFVKSEDLRIFKLDTTQKAKILAKKSKGDAHASFICNIEKKEYGFCENYHQRIEITEECKGINFDEIFGSKIYFTDFEINNNPPNTNNNELLQIGGSSINFTEIYDYLFVDSQKNREKILNFSSVDKSNFIEYSILEIISRSFFRGCPQENLLKFNLESFQTYHFVKQLISNRQIVKMRLQTPITEILNNLLILTKFYDFDKIPLIYHLSPDTLKIAPYDFYIAKTYEIISRNISIKETYDCLRKFFDLNILEFKNCLSFLCRSRHLIVLNGTDKIRFKATGRLFPVSSRILGDDQIDFYPDLWFLDSNHSNWGLMLCRVDYNEFLAESEEVKKELLYEISCEKIFNIPYERSIIAHVNDLVIINTPTGISQRV